MLPVVVWLAIPASGKVNMHLKQSVKGQLVVTAALKTSS